MATIIPQEELEKAAKTEAPGQKLEPATKGDKPKKKKSPAETLYPKLKLTEDRGND